MQISQQAVTIVKRYEGKGDGDLKKPNLQPYICPADVATIGYGHVLLHPQTKKQLRVSIYGRAEALRLADLVTKQRWGRDGITDAEADALLAEDLSKFSAEVNKLIGAAPTTQLQFDAFVSLAFNIGGANFGTSTLLRRHLAKRYDAGNRDMQYLAARSRGKAAITSTTEAFTAWSFSNGAWLAGLFKRRYAESAMYFGTDAAKAILIAEAYKR